MWDSPIVDDLRPWAMGHNFTKDEYYHTTYQYTIISSISRPIWFLIWQTWDERSCPLSPGSSCHTLTWSSLSPHISPQLFSLRRLCPTKKCTNWSSKMLSYLDQMQCLLPQLSHGPPKCETIGEQPVWTFWAPKSCLQ